MKILASLFAAVSSLTIYCAVAADKISLDIQGNEEIVDRLSSLTSIKKDEFENKTAFIKRLCEQTYKALGKSENDSITIGLEHGKYKAAWAQYDADREAFIFSIRGVDTVAYRPDAPFKDRFKWNTTIDFDEHNHEDVQIATKYRESSSTVSGSTIFGISKNVKVGVETNAGIYFPSKPIHLRGMRDEVTLQAKPEAARRLDKDLRVAIATKLQRPCFVSGQGHVSPTVDYPRDISVSAVGIIGAANPEWILYLDSTKEILKRGKFTFTSTERRLQQLRKNQLKKST